MPERPVVADPPKGPLAGVKVLDLSRILAGPSCTQLLGDLGATVLKIENPKTGGDDTRGWGPPYVEGAADLSAYFLCANRNKRSLGVDISTPQGQQIVQRLACEADLLVENFKPGGLAKYGLDYNSLKEIAPKLVYCSISGFGQTGPHREKPGYDLMAQGWAGVMSITGAADGPPAKVGVAVADVVAGLYAAVGLLAALRHAEATGQGQQIDLALVDTTVAWLMNQGTNYLTSGRVPRRQGNMHPNIVPYGVYACADGYVIVAVGNDSQFVRFCKALDRDDLSRDARFGTNTSRLAHRDILEPALEALLGRYRVAEVIARLEDAGVPVGPVQELDQVFGSDQVAARDMKIAMDAQGIAVNLIGNPLKFSATPVRYDHAPPRMGQDDDLLRAADIWADASKT